MTDRHFTMTLTLARGTVAIGGYSAVPEELDVAHARDPDGRAILPATAVRGALREACEAMVRAAGEQACRGGDGFDPRHPSSDGTPARPCALADGDPCRPCRLFGSQQVAGATGRMPFGALVLGDALHTGPEANWSITHGVTIDRARRSAREGLLFNREAPAAGDGLVFVATGRLHDPAWRDLLEAAAAMTCHIGSNLSRGLGRVDITLDWHPAPGDAAPLTPVGDGDRQLIVTLDRPASIGAPLGEENVRRTRLDIPGSALRGAVGWGIAEQLGAAGQDPDADAGFQALVADRDATGAGAIFDFLHPCAEAPPDGISGPWPLTRRTCKADARHVAADVLLDRIALIAARDTAEAARVLAMPAAPSRCPRCDAPLAPMRGWRGQPRKVSTRLVTRVSLDGRRRSARTGMLFTHELIDAGTRYIGSVRALPPGSGERLAEGLRAPLSLGRGRATGWGRISIETGAAPSITALDARRAAFTDALAAHLRAVGLADRLPIERLVVITLRAPMLPGGDGDDADQTAILDALGGGEVVLCVRRFDVENGWDQRHGARDRVQGVVAGSVYVIDPGRDWPTLRPIVERLEIEGIGEARCRGFGRVVFFDPALTNHEVRTMNAMQKGAENRRLVLAAETVMNEAFHGRLDRGRLSKSQMSQLIGVCQEATCHEEVVNYLRYQAGRSDPKWTLSMTERVYSAIAEVFTEEDIGEDDHPARMDRWRRYATYLARAFTYQDAARHAREKK